MRPYRFIFLAIAVIGSATSAALAQPPPPSPPAPGAPPLPGAAESLQSASGRVRQFLLAPQGEVDGLLLDDGAQVAVPPHLSAALTAAVQPGDEITAYGRRETSQRLVALSVSDAHSGQTVRDQGPPATPPAPPAAAEANPQRLSAQGTVFALLQGPRGEVNGLVLEEGTVIRFAPHVGLYYANLIKLGGHVGVSGMGVEGHFGRVIEAEEIRAE
jgi:hypothetical protein